MTPIRELPQFRQDCKRFQNAITNAKTDDDKQKLTSLYKDFLIKASSVDTSIDGIKTDFKDSVFTHKHLVDELTQARLRIENFIKSNIT
jgi:hypothetical protein